MEGILSCSLASSRGHPPIELPLQIQVSSCALHKGRVLMCFPQGTLGYKTKPTYPSRISVLTDQLNSVTKEYNLENVSGSCKHQHSLSTREAFSTIPSLSRKYSNFKLVRGLVRTSTTYSSVGRYCTSTTILCTMSRM